MLFYTGLLFLVIAVSLDGLAVGITYGMRNIRVPFSALSVIMLCSGMIVLLSMTIGNMFSIFISPQQAKILGGSILICLGLFSFVHMVLPTRERSQKKITIVKSDKKLHLFTTILTKPTKADLDQSGTISVSEAFFLGSALALDAFGAGIGASMLGYSPIVTTLLIAMMSGGFLYGGLKIGLLLSRSKPLQSFTFLPPVLLILLGLFNLF